MGDKTDRGSKRKDEQGRVRDSRRVGEKVRDVDYVTVLDVKAAQFLHKLPEKIRIRILKKLTTAQGDPLRFYGQLSGCQEYKLRVGDYRVIAQIDAGNGTIRVFLVGHRKNVYNLFTLLVSFFQRINP
ncbi:type II toxin-antitoxin system RelE/ParE family toxin [Nanoarchaeota archaeon]